MSVLKSKRKPSQFEVFHHLNKMRKEVTDLLLRDFGYDLDKAVKKVETTFGGRPYEESYHPMKKSDMKSSWKRTLRLQNGSSQTSEK
ncbi:hypothetical protein [Hominenteromicrobium sp.]|uniref:hypothetical protein n=1 Tax=Hominenteromicrobium sp. TaxID=3073581 RepID=UPI003A8D5F5B